MRIHRGQAAKEKVHFWEWKQSVSPEGHTQSTHKESSVTTPQPSEEAVAWAVAENFSCHDIGVP